MPHRDNFNILPTIFSTTECISHYPIICCQRHFKKTVFQTEQIYPRPFDAEFLNVIFCKPNKIQLTKATSGEILPKKNIFSNHFHYKPTKQVCQVLLCWCFKQKNREIFVNTDDFPILESIILLIFHKTVIY